MYPYYMVKRKPKAKKKSPEPEQFPSESEDEPQLKQELEQINYYILQEELAFFEKLEADRSVRGAVVPQNCIPVSADVTSFDFKTFAQTYREERGRMFDVIMMDPPWQLSGSAPTRGVTISYSALADQAISDLPLPLLQKNGFLFIWTINAKYRMTLKLFDKWGYKFTDEVIWVKKTCNNKIAKSHGYWLQHAKETCLVGVKGEIQVEPIDMPDVIFSLRRGQSQKPEEIYELIEKLVPNGNYLEIFGRRNNLRDNWVTIGNEI